MTLKEVVEYASIDWSKKVSTRTKMRTNIEECLKKYNYPPEYQQQAVDDIIEQVEYIINENTRKLTSLALEFLSFQESDGQL